MQYPDRIPYQAWINSQLSIARFYGGMTLNGKEYFVEPETNDLVAKTTVSKKKLRKAEKDRWAQIMEWKRNLDEQKKLPLG
jgi:hypothetical protein